MISISALFTVFTIPRVLLSQSSTTTEPTFQTISTIQSYTPTTTPAIPDLNNVTALAYIVTQKDGSVLLSKNIHQQFPLASITKLMTGVITLEKTKLGKIMRVSERAVTAFGDSGDLKAGERVTIENLLFPLFMESSNDAAEVITESLPVKNSRSAFIYYMNQKAKALKMTKTKFVDPSGLSAKNVSTVKDIEILLRYVEKKYSILLTITALKEYAQGSYTWVNTSSLSIMNGYVGGKTGFTTPAQQTAAGIFLTKTSRNAVEPLHYVLLYSKDRNVDTELLRRHIEYQAELVK